MVEYRLLADLTGELWRRGIEFDVLRADVDAHGYDLVIEAEGISRHIQLKAMRKGGARADVTINTRLAAKPSGCVIWMLYDPDTLSFTGFRWFGALPGEPLPPLGDRIAKHSKGNAAGLKAERAAHRVVPLRSFELLPDVATVADRLFGAVIADEHEVLRSLIAQDAPDQPSWLAAVTHGDYNAIPADLAWDSSAELAHVIDGYRYVPLADFGGYEAFLNSQQTVAEATGDWPGDATALWVTLFLAHRSARFSSPYLPTSEQLLNRLCAQLRDALVRLEDRA